MKTTEQAHSIKAPVAKKVPFEIETHGDVRVDHYYWMRDMERKDPEILAHLEAENAYTKAMMASTESLQESLFHELKGRIKEDDQSVPYFYDGFYYYSRFETGKEYPIYCRKAGSLDAEEHILLNVNEMAKDFSYYQLAGQSISTNNQIIAFGEDTLSRRIYTIRFKNLETGEYLEDQIENTSGGCTWANDNKTVFYTRKEEGTLRAFKIFKHVLGTDASQDEEVYHETDVTYNVGVGKSKSKKWIYIHSSASTSDEYRILNADAPEGEWTVFQPRQEELEYGLAHFDGSFYIITNHEAQNFRLMKCNEKSTALENWTEVIAHREDVLLEDVDVFESQLVLTEKSNAENNIRIVSWDRSVDYYIPFDEEVYAVGTTVNPDFKSTKLRFNYQSLTTPSSVLEFDFQARKTEVLKQQEVLGGFDKNEYVSERMWVTARDGAKVPVSIVRHKSTEPSADTPLLLYGYGSYGITVEPYFSPSRLSLLNRGFVFAIAHIRGGQMMGRQWYDNGKMLNKLNTFYDFIDCGEALVQKGYTSSEHLYAMGGSAGGLLMGAVINMRPDLWNGAIAAVPFVDVVTTMLDESIPLTTGEFSEWGNPKEEVYYNYIKTYSPYDNIEAKSYPHLLVTTGLHDSQVQYWEPAKWIALLRETKTDDNMLLFHINMEFGHGGASGRFEVYKEIALEYAFLLELEGIHK